MSHEEAQSPDTKTKILDTAERLFAEEGFGVSIRKLVQEAEVNLAAIHYHFQGKDGLIKAVLARRIQPLNDERISNLEALERQHAADEPLPVEAVLRTFLEPVIRQKFTPTSAYFNMMVGRILSDVNSPIWELMKENFEELASRFIPAFFRAMPGLPPREAMLRIELLIATMAHTMMEQHRFKKNCFDFDPYEHEDAESTLERLIAYNAAGMRVPYPIRNTPPRHEQTAGGDSA